MTLNSRNRAGSASALSTAARSAASSAPSGAPAMGVQQGTSAIASSRRVAVAMWSSLPRTLTDVDVWVHGGDIDIRQYGGGPMARVQLALNVSDVDAAVDFYSRLFQTEPSKRRPGYAN